MNAEGYAGDVMPSEAWKILESDEDAALVDVRTLAEWTFVGVPDLSELGKQLVTIEWQTYPSMEVNANFTTQLAEAGVPKDAPVLFLCRSGQRSRAAAIAATQAGFETCYNVSEGFEGGMDDAHHRGSVGGWKVAGLPWAQR
jgi:rhodanese-related sulfurtransferase